MTMAMALIFVKNVSFFAEKTYFIFELTKFKMVNIISFDISDNF